MNVYTIGFAGKSAEEFFSLLTDHKVKSLVDIRLNNKSQLAGFANAKHLPYFLGLHNIVYEHRGDFAPTKELLDGYKKKSVSWEEYVVVYKDILKERDIINKINSNDFADTVLLCSEKTAEQCHRRLFAEFLAQYDNSIVITHL